MNNEQRLRDEVRAVLADVTSYAAVAGEAGDDDASLQIDTSWLEAPDVERLAHALLRAAKIMRGTHFVTLKCGECEATIELEFTSGKVPESLSLRHEPPGRQHGVVTWSTSVPGAPMLTAYVPGPRQLDESTT